jgi:hypothetical protein
MQRLQKVSVRRHVATQYVILELLPEPQTNSRATVPAKSLCYVRTMDAVSASMTPLENIGALLTTRSRM